jgi:hypothetical protein
MDNTALMQALAAVLDETLNGKSGPKRVGFALLTYNFGEPLNGTGQVNYVGNGQRDDVRAALKELLARWEGRYGETAGKQ